MAKKQSAPQPYVKPDSIQIRGDEIFSPLRKKWLKNTPEERVRQEFIHHLHEHYGYEFDQMAQERKTQHVMRHLHATGVNVSVACPSQAHALY